MARNSKFRFEDLLNHFGQFSLGISNTKSDNFCNFTYSVQGSNSTRVVPGVGVQIIPINPPGVNPPNSAVPIANGEVVVETTQNPANPANRTPSIVQNPSDPT